MKPDEFLKSICAPAVSELKASPDSLRHAWHAAVSLFHYVDILNAARAHRAAIAPTTLLPTTRSEIQAGFPRFQVLADVANALKHFQLERKGARAGLSIGNLKTGPAAPFSDGSYFDDGTSFNDMGDCIRVEFNGEIIDVPQLCAECLMYLQTIKV